MTQIGEGTATGFDFGGLLEPGSLEVSVVERTSGEPVAGVEVMLQGPTPALSVTDGDGVARFDALDPGPYWIAARQPEFDIVHGKDALILDTGEAATLSLRVKRVMLSVTIKRDHIRGLFYALIGQKGKTEYGHWWIDIDGIESYGWWPAIGAPGLTALMGVPGQLNGMLHSPGTATQDLHHPDSGDEEFHPLVINGSSAAAVKDCIRTFAHGYSGTWSWPWGQNCHSFQEEMMEHCGLARESD